ncbi:outer membrane protein [Gammaproteobacteria bacterium]
MGVCDMKKLILSVSVLLVLSFSSIGFAEMKVGVIDVNRIFANVQQIKNMQANLKKLFDPRGQQIVNLQQSFRASIEKYRQDNTSLQGEALKKEQQKLVDENNKLQEEQLGFQRDLVAAQNQALQPVLAQVKGIVDRIAQEQKFDLIVIRVSTAYNNPQFEITDQVIAEMEKAEAGKVEIAKPDPDTSFLAKIKQK